MGLSTATPSPFEGTPSAGNVATFDAVNGRWNPTAALPMSIIPNAKLRLDVHLFNQTLCATARRSGRFTLTVPAGMSANNGVRVWPDSLPGTNKGQRIDWHEFDHILLVAQITSDTTVAVNWSSRGPIVGNFNFFYQIRN